MFALLVRGALLNRVLVLALCLGLVLAGGLALTRLPVDVLPEWHGIAGRRRPDAE